MAWFPIYISCPNCIEFISFFSDLLLGVGSLDCHDWMCSAPIFLSFCGYACPFLFLCVGMPVFLCCMSSLLLCLSVDCVWNQRLRVRTRESAEQRGKSSSTRSLGRGISGLFDRWTKPAKTISIPLLVGWMRWGISGSVFNLIWFLNSNCHT